MSNYAPEYTRKERIVIAAKILAWVIPLFLIGEFWFFDWLAEYSANANCYKYGNISGVHLLTYGVFVLLPLLFATVIFLTEGRRSIKVIKLGQNPLPDEKVLRPTKYKYGVAAKIQPFGAFFILLFLIGLSIWGGFQAHELTGNIKPCTVNKSFSQNGAKHAPPGWLDRYVLADYGLWRIRKA